MTNLVFSSCREFARLLFEDDAVRPLLLDVKQVLQAGLPANVREERLRPKLERLDQYLRSHYFYPPPDPKLVQGAPREHVILRIQGDTGFWLAVASVDPGLPDVEVVSALRRDTDRYYGGGAFDRLVVGVHRGQRKNLLDESLPAPALPTGACEAATEII